MEELAAGTFYVLAKARDNLIAVKNLTKQGLTFEGDNSKMVFRDGSGAIVLTARDEGDGFFSCSLADLEQADVAIKSVKALAKTEEVAPVPVRELHISAEERKRALAFMEWHSRQMHPSDRAAIVMFNSGSMMDCQFTAADVRNARALFASLNRDCASSKSSLFA